MADFYPAVQVAVIAIITIILRFLPFIVFSKKDNVPDFINYFGKVLPPAIMGMLVIYCLRGTTFKSAEEWLIPMVSVLCVVFLHILKRNTLLSIVGGTVLYMLLINIF